MEGSDLLRMPARLIAIQSILPSMRDWIDVVSRVRASNCLYSLISHRSMSGSITPVGVRMHFPRNTRRRVRAPKGLHKPAYPSAEPTSPRFTPPAPSRTPPLTSSGTERALDPPHSCTMQVDSHTSPITSLSALAFLLLVSTPQTQTRPGEGREVASAGPRRSASRDDRGSWRWPRRS